VSEGLQIRQPEGAVEAAARMDEVLAIAPEPI
jgi:hypothetical protein